MPFFVVALGCATDVCVICVVHVVVARDPADVGWSVLSYTSANVGNGAVGLVPDVTVDVSVWCGVFPWPIWSYY